MGHLNIGPVYRVGQVKIDHSSKTSLFQEIEGEIYRESEILDPLWYCVFRASRGFAPGPTGGSHTFYIHTYIIYLLRAFIGVETAALTFRTKQYSTSYRSHICYRKRFCNDLFLNHNTIALVRNSLKFLSCVVIETALDGMKKNQLS